MPAVGKHREPIIQAAIMHFRQQGYPGTGLNEILATSGAPKGSLYHYFPDGKSSIAVAAIREAGKLMTAVARQVADNSKTPEDFVRGYLKTIAVPLRQSKFRDGCPITTVLLELAPDNREVTKAGYDAHIQGLEVIQDVLERDGIKPSLSKDIACLWMSSFKGALVQARIYKSTKPLERIADMLIALLPAVRELK